MSTNKEVGLHPLFDLALRTVLQEMAGAGHPMVITDGVRTVEQQQGAWRKGRDAAGNVIDARRIVTHCDGIRVKSNHQIQDDGFGHAADCTFLDPVMQQPRWLDSDPWHLYMDCARRHGLVCGGDWPAPKTDKPHVELPHHVATVEPPKAA